MTDSIEEPPSDGLELTAQQPAVTVQADGEELTVLRTGSAAPGGTRTRSRGRGRSRPTPSAAERAAPGGDRAVSGSQNARIVQEVDVDELLDDVLGAEVHPGAGGVGLEDHPELEVAGAGGRSRRTSRRRGETAASLAAAGPDVLPSTPPPRTVTVPSKADVRAARRVQARKVGRLVRHVDLWSVMKVSLLFYLCMLVVFTVSGSLIWTLLQRRGAVSSVEGFIEQIFLVENFHFEGAYMFRIGVLLGLVGVLVLTLLTVLAGLLFNLISDLTGGVRVSVVELETARAAPTRRRR